MAYTVTIAPSSGQKHTFNCAGSNDQEALIYAGKIVEQFSTDAQSSARVVIERDGTSIGPETTVGDMLNRKG